MVSCSVLPFATLNSAAQNTNAFALRFITGGLAALVLIPAPLGIAGANPAA